jgi:hypothetical protein
LFPVLRSLVIIRTVLIAIVMAIVVAIFIVIFIVIVIVGLTVLFLTLIECSNLYHVNKEKYVAVSTARYLLNFMGLCSSGLPPQLWFPTLSFPECFDNSRSIEKSRIGLPRRDLEPNPLCEVVSLLSIRENRLLCLAVLQDSLNLKILFFLAFCMRRADGYFLVLVSIVQYVVGTGGLLAPCLRG